MEETEEYKLLRAGMAELKVHIDTCLKCDGTGSIKNPALPYDEMIACPYCQKAREICDKWEELTT